MICTLDLIIFCSMFQGVKVHKKSAELQYITQIFEDGMYLTP